MNKLLFGYISVLVFILLPFNSKTQVFAKYWRITDVKNTLLELGVASPSNTEFTKIRRSYLGGKITFSNGVFMFSKRLRLTEAYSDTVFLGNKYVVNRKVDTEISLRYPGDELDCDSISNSLNICYVGDSFMRLINLDESFLTYYDAKGNSPNIFVYKVCLIKNNKIALFCTNANIILILTER